MHHAFRDRKALPWPQFDSPAFQVDLEAPLDDVEELVFLVVLVPVELALEDAEPDDAVIHPAERLVVPRVLTRVDERLDVDELERTISCIRGIE